MEKRNNPTKVVTGVCTFSYLNCWEPRAIEGSKPKYSVSLIIPKSDTATVTRIREPSTSWHFGIFCRTGSPTL